MNLLLDTDVLSLLRRQDRHPELVQWLRNCQSHTLFLSVVSIGEVERGIEKQRRSDPNFARDLTVWLETLLSHFDRQILPITVPIARRWGQLSAKLHHTGADLLIAATALEHDLVVVTRNTRHFTPTGVKCLDPLAASFPLS
ncbi:MAG: type II toxin-antitoxin system VapC family toxin [Candidatus Competibacteraceae bacterium]|nr:type II toxin-antitoxin system VapC family toxin [Candidatus Competibacteraceae bacterium]